MLETVRVEINVRNCYETLSTRNHKKKENRNDNDGHRFHLRQPTFANDMGEISG